MSQASPAELNEAGGVRWQREQIGRQFGFRSQKSCLPFLEILHGCTRSSAFQGQLAEAYPSHSFPMINLRVAWHNYLRGGWGWARTGRTYSFMSLMHAPQSFSDFTSATPSADGRFQIYRESRGRNFSPGFSTDLDAEAKVDNDQGFSRQLSL